MDDTLIFSIDLNMLRGDHVRSHVDFIENTLRARQPEIGDTVYAVDEDGARYLAVIESLDANGFVRLYLKRESRYKPTEPRVLTQTAGSTERVDRINEIGTKSRHINFEPSGT